MKFILTIIIFTVPISLLAQLGRDSLLVNERSIDRPIIVHDKQLRITGAYNFATLTSRFDENGDKIELSTDGKANILQNLQLDIKYGFLDILQLNVILNHVTNIQREQPINIITAPLVDITETSRLNGLEDVFVGVDFLVPWQTRKIDLVFSGGVTLPTANHEPDQPSHTFDDTNGFVDIDYVFNENRGLGVIKTFVGTQFKYRLDNFAFSAFFRYGFPIEESESLIWDHRVTSANDFQYQSRPFSISPSDSYTGLIEVEYQLYPWIDLFLDIEQRGTVGGWTEETGNRIALPEERLTFINPGVEILLTTKFWLRQRVVFAISGESALSPFSVQTALIYNFFPF